MGSARPHQWAGRELWVRYDGGHHMPIKQRRKLVSASPLIDAAVCSLVLLAPDQPTYAALPEPVRSRFAHNTLALTAAAGIMDVPVFVSWPGPDRPVLAPYLSPGATYRHFTAGDYRSLWDNPAFVAELTEENRTAVLIGGFWLEYQVLATGLHALADAYDVYVLSDAARAQSRAAALTSHNRLMMQGARPALTSQVIHEWSVAADQAKHTGLERLLEGLLPGRTPIGSGLVASL